MRLSSFTAALLSVGGLASVAAFNLGTQDPIVADDNTKVPGESPLELCPGEHGGDIVRIERVDLSPNPPLQGKNLDIVAVGTVKEAINQGAYVMLQVKYGLIRLINTKADLCETVGNVDLECPVKPGVLRVTKTVELPADIPPGKYTVLADVYNNDNKKITCLTATVQFSRGGAGAFFQGFDL